MTSRTIESQTLQHFLRNHLIALGTIITIVYSVSMSTLYDWGLDDASEFYLFQDAESAEELLNQGLPLPDNTSFKRFYLDTEDLPSRYQTLFKSQINNSENSKQGTPELRHIEEDDTFEYVLYYPLKTTTNNSTIRSLFVIHRFNLTEDQNIPGLSVSQVVLIVSMIALSFILLSSTIIYNTINNAIRTFYHWGKGLSDNEPTTKIEKIPLAQIRFKELQIVGNTLEKSVQHILDLTEREKSFARCLSHELRTPMAVISAAIDILDKKTLPDGIDAKLQKIRTANNSMIQTSDTLLKIWREQRTTALPENINLHSFVSEILADNQYRTSSNPLTVNNALSAELTFNVEKEPFHLVVSNLLKNAIQYASGNSIHISATRNSITIANDCEPVTKNHRPIHTEYGYGLGLFIAETVAKQQHWTLVVKQKAGLFIAELQID